MSRLLRHALALVSCLAVALFTPLPALGQDLRLAVTDIAGLENLQREYAPFQNVLSEKSGVRIALFPVPNRTAAVEALTARKVDLVLTGPAEYVVFKKRTDAKLVVGIYRHEYHGSVVTLMNSGIDGIEDLKGRKIAVGDVGSTSRHLSPLQILADHGLNPQKDVQVIHLNRNVAVEAMKRGDIAAVGINRTDLSGLTKKFPDAAFKVIARGRDLPSDVILAGAHVSDEVIAKLRKTFAENSDSLVAAILQGPDENQKFLGMRFIAAISDKDYNYVRRMYSTIGQPQFDDFVGK